MYIKKELHRGYNPYLSTEPCSETPGDAGTQMDVGVLVLRAGDSFVIEEPEKEAAVCLLEGDLTIRYAGKSADCARRNMFQDEAWCLLAPAGTRIELGTKGGAECYIQKTVNETAYEPVLFSPEDVITQHAGANGELGGCIERQIKTFFDYDNAPFSNMVLGEVLNYPGKWSSYPPHHHPQPEVYFYRFDRSQGLGVSMANGESYVAENNGLTVINHGYHSQAAAPGYAMCYLWGIRHLDGDPWLKTRIDEPEHEWLLQPDVKEHICTP